MNKILTITEMSFLRFLILYIKLLYELDQYLSIHFLIIIVDDQRILKVVR